MGLYLLWLLWRKLLQWKVLPKTVLSVVRSQSSLEDVIYVQIDEEEEEKEGKGEEEEEIVLSKIRFNKGYSWLF